MYDVIIVGAGPAGMTAAVYAARKKLKALLISKDFGGQALWAANVENYMGYQFIGGTELMQKFEAQVRQFPLDQKIGEGVAELSMRDGGFEIKTDKGESYQTKAVVLASGKRPKQLNVPGEDKLKGKGVSYCAICDGPLFTGEKIAVVGGGNSALEAVDDMVKIGEHVYLVSTTALNGDQVLVNKLKDASNLTTFLEWQVVEIEGSSLVEGMRIRNLNTDEEKRLEVAGVFVEIGLVPNSDFATGTVNLNELGEIEVSCTSETNVAGLFAAGDVTNVPEKQIVVAAGEGAKATLQAHRYLQRL
jgi:alkyl hydroperoxide reductase subunit F